MKRSILAAALIAVAIAFSPITTLGDPPAQPPFPYEFGKVLCTLSGSAGDHVVCPVYMVKGSNGVPDPTGVQFEFSKDGIAEFTHITDGEFCPNGLCIPYSIPDVFTTLQTGHSVSLAPVDITAWGPGGSVIIADTASSGDPIIDAYYSGTTLVGEPKLFSLHFILLDDVDPQFPLPVHMNSILVTNQNAAPIKATIVGSEPGIIVLEEYVYQVGQCAAPGSDPLNPQPINNGQPCDSGSACVVGSPLYDGQTACVAGYCYGEPLNCDDGNPCTIDYCDSAQGCKHSPTDCVCSLWGEIGDTVSCNINLAKASSSIPDIFSAGPVSHVDG